MAGLAHRWLTRSIGVATAAVLITGGAAGVTFAAESAPTVAAAETWLPSFEVTSKFGVVATTHPDTVGCDGYNVTGSGTSTGRPITSGTWTQTEVACKATIPGKWDIKGTGTITEPDGDKLHVSYQLTAPLTSDTMVYPTGTYKITGGTGNYQFATGTGKMNARVNMLDHSDVTSTMMGTIEYLG
ncbi:hypothetical protein ABZ135_17730 [Streptomyces sp. NPDC006339]|uniref:hypothetical protein n=1 Tax=Streptomyces sp. NPDC006339 TaxID=3156755 RepID=UPI0033B65C5A